MPKEIKSWSALLYSCFLAISLWILWVRAEEPRTPCPEMCKCIERDDAGTGMFFNTYIKCLGVVRDLDGLQFFKNTTVLDMSGTSLENVPSYFFLDGGLLRIVELDLSRNRLTNIYHDMFIGLNELEILNLNYNDIQYFDPRSLIYNDALTRLYMAGTSVPLTENSFVISHSLKVLDLSNCDIVELPELALSEIPRLEILNVSLNPLRQIKPEALYNLLLLKQVDITKTNIRCDHSLTALSEWGKVSKVALTGYPCLNSHSSQSHWYKSNRKGTTKSGSDEEWPVFPLDDHEYEYKEEFGTNPGDEVDSDNESPHVAMTSIDNIASVWTESVDTLTTESSTDGSNDANQSELFLHINWTILLACAGGFGLGIAFTIFLGFTMCYCCKRPEDSNELVSAGEDFQLVSSPDDHPPVIRDAPPSYSSLFSSRYHKVLPTAPLHSNRLNR